MCGIGMVFHYKHRRPVDQAELSAMGRSMRQRGPDSSGAWRHANTKHVGFVHRRLAILDLSAAGHQPMHSDEGHLVLSYNGEIYNYPSLRRELEADGYAFESDSDTEALLHLYHKYGRDMVDHLRGMYAFALWDREAGGVLLARDPYGIKPLYYADDGQSIRAASQVKALLATESVDTAAEPAGHVGFFLWGHVPDPYTLYRGIRALPAGHTMWIDKDGVGSPSAHVTPVDVLRDASGSVSSTRRPSASDGILRKSLLETVEAHLLADVDVGIFLSAGLDSATLLALASEVTSNLHTITLGFEEFRGSADNEVPLASALADHYGANHDVWWVTRSDFADAHDNLFDAMDQPSIDGVNSYFVSQAAAQSGLKVALSGLGGDELFGGYPSFHQIPRLVKYASAVPYERVIGRSLRSLLEGTLASWTSPKTAGILEYGGSYPGAYLLRRSLYMPWELPKVLDADMVRAGLDTLDTCSQLNATLRELTHPHEKVSALETAWYMRHQLLRDSDWASMTHSLEIRVPLVDVELLRRIAPLLQTGVSKRDMATTPRKGLPEAVLHRSKTGFSVPVREWLLAARPDLQARGLRGWATYVYDQYWN